jgi:hypothetical protein
MSGIYRGYLTDLRTSTGESKMTDEPRAVDAEPSDPDLDTTDGRRDPLTTDEGLLAAAADMPTTPVDVGHGGASEDAAQHRELQDVPELDVDEDGNDPTAELATPGDGAWSEIGPGFQVAPLGTPAPEVL